MRRRSQRPACSRCGETATGYGQPIPGPEPRRHCAKCLVDIRTPHRALFVAGALLCWLSMLAPLRWWIPIWVVLPLFPVACVLTLSAVEEMARVQLIREMDRAQRFRERLIRSDPRLLPPMDQPFAEDSTHRTPATPHTPAVSCG